MNSNFTPVSRFLLLLALTCASFFRTQAQPITAYVNMQKQFTVWDRNMIREIEFLQPLDYKIGRTAIPYFDNARSFKIYYGGGAKKINIGFTSEFQVTDNLVPFLNNKQLSVFEQGKITTLSLLTAQYYYGDSLVLFKDSVRSEWKIYYNGAIQPAENFLADNAILDAQVSDNVAAYVNYANQFRIFFRGSLLKQEDYAVKSFQVGRNTVGYVDANRRFRVFHNGVTMTLDEYPPATYTVGDNVIAYTTNDGYFKVFYGDSVRTIGFFTPTDYRVADNVVTYRDAGGYFRIFYKGEIYTLDTYYPDQYRAQYNSVAYIDRTNTLRLFTAGEVFDVTSGTDDWRLDYDVVRYATGPNVYRVFYRGQDD